MAHAGNPEREWSASRGREARAPGQIPAPGWRDILWRVKDRIAADNLSIISAGVAFYALLAIFPALIALVGLYGMLFDPQQVSQHLSALTAVLPGEAANLIGEQLGEVTSMERTSLGVGSIAAVLVALWSASAGMRTLMTALDVAYGEKETRGTFKFYGSSFLLTLGAVLGGLVAIATIVAVPIALHFLGLDERTENIVSYARWPLLAVVVLVGLAIVYRYGPDRAKPQWRWVSWGAGIATLLWIGGSALFSLYVTRFGDYNKTYGSIGAVVILMTWFLLTAYIFLIGAEINAELERQTRKDTTEGSEKPLGRRDAHAADTVGHTPCGEIRRKRDSGRARPAYSCDRVRLDHYPGALHLSDAPSAPEAGGVYVLWRGGLPVYVGRTAEGQSLRRALEWHLDKSDAEADPATHFTFEACDDRAAREAEAKLLAANFRLSGGIRS